MIQHQLSLEKKQAIETSDRIIPSVKAKTAKTEEHRRRIIEFLKDNGRSSCTEIAEFLGLSPARTRALLSDIPEIEAIGAKRYRTYRIR